MICFDCDFYLWCKCVRIRMKWRVDPNDNASIFYLTFFYWMPEVCVRIRIGLVSSFEHLTELAPLLQNISYFDFVPYQTSLFDLHRKHQVVLVKSNIKYILLVHLTSIVDIALFFYKFCYTVKTKLRRLKRRETSISLIWTKDYSRPGPWDWLARIYFKMSGPDSESVWLWKLEWFFCAGPICNLFFALLSSF